MAAPEVSKAFAGAWQVKKLYYFLASESLLGIKTLLFPAKTLLFLDSFCQEKFLTD